ncbi:hypothetical protein WMF04_22235 [Sorangium sp. So ce260]|uniref:hypothetical protein n=1 Tax=Sorangium sp. So ce260 TaxID=3133291 RepID=UPI003F5E6025
MSRPHDGRAQRARPARSASGPLHPVLRAAFAGAAVLGAVRVLSVAEAHAAPELRPRAARLEYVRGRGAERCPDASFLRAEVARVAGADPFRDDAPLLISARIERHGAELVASLALRDAQGKTRWADGLSTSGACEVLVAGMGLAIGTRLLTMPARVPREPAPREPAQGGPPGPPGPPPPAQAPPGQPGPLAPTPAARATPEPSGRIAPEPQPASGEEPQPASGEEPQPASGEEPQPASGENEKTMAAPFEPLRFEAGLGATVGLGITPGVAAGTTLALGVHWSDWSVAVEGRGLVSLAREVADMDISTTAFTMVTVACRRGRLMFGCGLGTVGAVRFVPQDPWNMHVRSKALFGVGARLGSAWPLSDGWSVHGHAEAIWIVEDALLRRQSDGSETPAPPSWSSPPLAAALGLGITATY